MDLCEEGIVATESIYRKFGIAATFNEFAEVPEVEGILAMLKNSG